MTDKFTHPDDAPEGHEWQTRDGREVKQVTTFDVDEGWSIRAVVGGEVLGFDHQGKHGLAKYFDLIDKPKKPREWWLVVEPSGTTFKYDRPDYANSAADLEDEIIHVREVIDA